MPQSADQFSGIFICYRRDDSGGHAGRLYDRLVAHFGDEQIFMDLDRIEPGEDFVHVLERAVGSCEVLLALVGRGWLTSRDETGRRLDNPNDFVRIEIVSAFARDVRVIPVLVQGAQMPRAQDLPEALQPLSRRQAFDLSDQRWRQDVDRLVSTLDRILARQRKARRAAAEEESERQRREVAARRQTEVEAQRQAEESERRRRAAAEAEQRKRDDEEAEWPKRKAEALGHNRAVALTSTTGVEESEASVLPWPIRLTRTLLRRVTSLANEMGKVPFVISIIVGLMLSLAFIVWRERVRNEADINSARDVSMATPTPQPTPAGTQLAGSTTPFTNSAGMEFVWIPQGSFMMGSENGEPDEKPMHRVTIGEGFYMDKYEVTQAQWHVVMGKNPSSFKGCDNCPVEHVTWDDVQEFIQRLNAQNNGYTYRLPSEAEWEYAARAGTTGDDADNLDAIAWHKKNPASTNPVGKKQPNAFGLFDMLGNVWEWCQDSYHDTYNSVPEDGRAWLSKYTDYKVIRGGGWGEEAANVSLVRRYRARRGGSSSQLGFRVAAAAVRQ